VVTHPVGEAEMQRQELLRLVPKSQPCPVRRLIGVEQADSDIDAIGGGRGERFAGRNRVTREQQMAPLGFERDRATNGFLHLLLPPFDGRDGRDGTEVPQFDGVELRAEQRRGTEAHSGLADAGGAGNEQQHTDPSS
jgi:hypothetical protein